jgi:riboflavin synthase
MFTGIIEEVGEVLEARDGFLRVRAERVREGTRLGDSIAIDGVDLTVTAIDEAGLAFNVMPESYRRTSLRRLGRRARINLERSVRAGDRLGGHLVRGVVETTGRLRSRQPDGDAVILSYAAPAEFVARTAETGPVCVDGVSLTVIAKDEGMFSVSVVAFTQANTTLLDRQVGDLVNLESDIVMRYVIQALQARGVL